MEYASNEIRNMEHEHEKGNTGHSPCMKSGIWDHENYPILEYRKRENMKLGIWNKVILKFELGNLHHPLGSPILSGTGDWVSSALQRGGGGIWPQARKSISFYGVRCIVVSFITIQKPVIRPIVVWYDALYSLFFFSL